MTMNKPLASLEMEMFNNLVETFDWATNFAHDRLDLLEIVSLLAAKGKAKTAEYFIAVATDAGVLKDDSENEPDSEACQHSWKALGTDTDGNSVAECRKCGEIKEQ